MKKSLYLAYSFIQFFTLLLSIENVCYCIFASDLQLFSSIFLFFIPCQRFLSTGNCNEILILSLFIVISLALFIFSTKELFNKATKKSIFLPAYYFWFITATFISLLADSSNTKGVMNYLLNSEEIWTVVYNIIPIILGAFVIFAKLTEVQNNIRNLDNCIKSEYFTPEGFQMQAKSYNQIFRTAKGVPVISSLCFLFSILMIYISDNVHVFLNFLYGLTFAIILIISFGNVYEFKRYKNVTHKAPPSKDFFIKMSLMQIISVVLFVLSFAFISFI